MVKFIICALMLILPNAFSASYSRTVIPAEIIDALKKAKENQHFRIRAAKHAEDITTVELHGKIMLPKKAGIEFRKSIDLQYDDMRQLLSIVHFKDFEAAKPVFPIVIYLQRVIAKNRKNETLIAADVQKEYDTSEYYLNEYYDEHEYAMVKKASVFCGVSIYFKRGELRRTPRGSIVADGVPGSGLTMIVEKLFVHETIPTTSE